MRRCWNFVEICFPPLVQEHKISFLLLKDFAIVTNKFSDKISDFTVFCKISLLLLILLIVISYKEWYSGFENDIIFIC